MEHYVGIDISLALSSVCVLDGAGAVVREAKVASEPDALVGFLRDLGLPIANVGLEAGPLSAWLYDGLKARVTRWLCSRRARSRRRCRQWR